MVGEAAALGIGMVMLGSADKAICDELMQYGQVWCDGRAWPIPMWHKCHTGSTMLWGWLEVAGANSMWGVSSSSVH